LPTSAILIEFRILFRLRTLTLQKEQLIYIPNQSVMKNPILSLLKKTGLSIILLIVLLVLCFPQKAFVISMILGGKIIAPEGAEILSHYCFGNGDTLELNPDYIKQSDIFLKNAKKLKTGQTKKVVFNQAQDWRLSYALNPFHIRKLPKGYLVYQNIRFDESGKVFTILDFKITKVKVYDNIVHTFECKPFIAVCRIGEDE